MKLISSAIGFVLSKSFIVSFHSWIANFIDTELAVDCWRISKKLLTWLSSSLSTAVFLLLAEFFDFEFFDDPFIFVSLLINL